VSWNSNAPCSRVDHRRVAFRAWRQRAERRPTDGTGRRGSDGGDDRLDVDAQDEEFGHGRQQVEGRAIDVEDMHIARDDVRVKTRGQQAAACVKPERAGAVTDVERDAAFAREQRFLTHRAIGAKERIRERPVAVRQYVAGP
jgi:hypothetical protein